jgi:uncharacterized protein YjbI with pentapeptide repeats
MTYQNLQDRVMRHEQWQSSEGKLGEQLAEAGLDFSGQTLDGRNLAGALIPGARLRGMTIRGTDFHGANLGGADLSDTVLVDVVLVKANLDNANLRNLTVKGGTWFRATCEDAQTQGLRFSGTNLDRAFPDLRPFSGDGE